VTAAKEVTPLIAKYKAIKEEAGMVSFVFVSFFVCLFIWLVGCLFNVYR
jgi:hypothetical protein